MWRPKQLEDENNKLPKLVAGLSLYKEMNRDAMCRKQPVRKRKLVDETRGDWDVSVLQACRMFLLDTSAYHYKFRRPGQSAMNNELRRFARRGKGRN